MISGSGLLSLLITLIVVGLVFWLIWWFLDYIGLPEPFNKVAKVILGLVALVFLINVLLSMIGHPLVKF